MSVKRIKRSKWENSAKLLGAVTLSLAVFAGCSAGGGKVEPTAASTQQQTVKQVKTAKVGKLKISEPIEQVADVLPVIQLDIMAKAGGDVLEITKKRGEIVQAGDVILKLNPTDLQISRQRAVLGLQSAENSRSKAAKDLETGKQEMANGVLKAEKGLQELTRNFTKMQNDYDYGLVTQAQLDQAQLQLDNTKLDLDILRQKQKTMETSDNLAALDYQVQTVRLSLEELDRTISNLEVKAPVSGILTELPVVTGMTLAPGFKVGQVQQLNPIKIKALLTDEGAKLIRGKQELDYSLPGTDVKGKASIEFLSDVMDSQSKSYELELRASNEDGKLKPGMKLHIQLTEETEQIVVAIPTLSVVREGSDSYVFVLNGDKAERRKVELGRLNELNQEVLSGVKEDETIIVSGQNQLKDNEQVQVQ